MGMPRTRPAKGAAPPPPPGTASPAGGDDNAEPPAAAASTVVGAASDGQNAEAADNERQSVQEVEASSTTTVTSVAEEKPSSADHDAFAVVKGQPSSASSEPSSTLIIRTQLSPSSRINLLGNDLDVEAFGLIPLFVIGISLFLALGVYFNQANVDDTDKHTGKRDDETRKNNEPGFVETSKNLLQRVKDAGAAGAVSYALWEAAFWGVSVPVCLTSYRQVTGHWPDMTSGEDVRKVGLEAFAFVNFARLAVPVRVGLALSTIPWVEQNILTRINGGVDRNAGVDIDEGASISASSIDNEQSPQGYDTGGDVRETQRTIRTTSGSSVVVPWQPVVTKSSPGDDKYPTSDSLAVSQVEDRLRQMETEASLISSLALQKVNAGIDPALLMQKKQAKTDRDDGSFGEYCEPGQVDEDCADYIRGYLDSLASTGAVATDGEVRAIVGYLDSLSSNVTPSKSTGAAFTNYLDALSSGYIPAPSSAKAVASYLDALSDVTAPYTSATGQVESGAVGPRINEVEERLNRLESSITRLPDDIAFKLAEWQIRQERKLAEDTEKIIKLLVEGKLLEK